ncbi:phosphatase PAP2 family protein [Zophobihabitans entericus]|uniref:undecaprenyl-diphosphate phosphatase n=1 Tax=Zophobihabitans entericus TaxID=1635327 RepID=A0A6G9IDN7_9GAMM|nr:phosphatase PAP2 family protein [Zophobihabitans entericus]QIQ21932.1 phosphatase PAP2 family protein [Zophobihabitans entericus]
MLAQLNSELFLFINAAQNANVWMIQFAIFCANYLVYFCSAFTLFCWLRLPQYREVIVKITLTIGFTLLIASLMRMAVSSPRPFVEHIGTNFLRHSATNSLPSQHASFIFAMLFAMVFNRPLPTSVRYKSVLGLMILIAGLVGWSRIYLGVHWPKDILAAGMISLACACFIAKSWNKIEKPLMHSLLKVYRSLFSPIIKLGLIKY